MKTFPLPETESSGNSGHHNKFLIHHKSWTNGLTHSVKNNVKTHWFIFYGSNSHKIMHTFLFATMIWLYSHTELSVIKHRHLIPHTLWVHACPYQCVLKEKTMVFVSLHPIFPIWSLSRRQVHLTTCVCEELTLAHWKTPPGFRRIPAVWEKQEKSALSFLPNDPVCMTHRRQFRCRQ